MKTWIRRLLLLAASVVSLVLLAAVGLIGLSVARQRKIYRVPVAALRVAHDSATVARGKHVVTAIAACSSCHGADLGGAVAFEQPLLGRFVASNLTSGRGGLPGGSTDTDLIRAIRHGLRGDGTSLLFMPSDAFQSLGDQDVAAVVAYLRTIEPVDRVLPPTHVGPLGRVLHALGFPLLSAEGVDHRSDTARSRVPSEGARLATVAGCHGCHGPQLRGGAGPGPDLMPALESWSERDFHHALRTGTRPDGTRLSEVMPWKSYAQMTDAELAALWRYLQEQRVRAVAERQRS